ncbi:CopG family transcriptional regulator [Aphanothece hegewaldii CCALA 016]|uniref:CopG family transcriptional regulator n=1 Tax=Aphanothece hegewaldii CCALA 016 TaxID=2107694 RepID=A0A2T1LX76_9CHRO|nr:CopG family transcriptional regulator [Aphanothece hegewaldii]PSF36790.1 CopG family transcriptional regulator [Aphanothece hegewaldii CCALA 016]
MKPTTVYLAETTQETLQQIAHQTGRTEAELIQEAIEDYLARQKTKVLPKSVGIGASGMSNLSERSEELLWSDE